MVFITSTPAEKIVGPSGGLTIQHTDGETRISFLIPIRYSTHKAEDWKPPEETYSNNEVGGAVDEDSNSR